MDTLGEFGNDFSYFSLNFIIFRLTCYTLSQMTEENTVMVDVHGYSNEVKSR